ncbi:hypothetical protein ABID26_004049 [Mesorhizobium shonense]|uniref:Uncharacterized protein n=1 Tax=Mesorhizobium shonense TaxID=1209948 RepID=A0ABV2HVL6_9HYPH
MPAGARRQKWRRRDRDRRRPGKAARRRARRLRPRRDRQAACWRRRISAQPLAPGACPGWLRPSKRVEGAQGGAGPEGGVGIMQRANGERPSRDGGGRGGGVGSRGIEANHAFEGKMPVRFAPSILAKNAQLVGVTKRMIMLPYQSFSSCGQLACLLLSTEQLFQHRQRNYGQFHETLGPLLCSPTIHEIPSPKGDSNPQPSDDRHRYSRASRIRTRCSRHISAAHVYNCSVR